MNRSLKYRENLGKEALGIGDMNNVIDQSGPFLATYITSLAMNMILN